MAFAPATVPYNNILGVFVEKEFGHNFEYVAAIHFPSDAWKEFDKLVFVGSSGEQRFAKILKTVAYIVTDEDENGNPIVEKWQIRQKWRRG